MYAAFVGIIAEPVAVRTGACHNGSLEITDRCAGFKQETAPRNISILSRKNDRAGIGSVYINSAVNCYLKVRVHFDNTARVYG